MIDREDLKQFTRKELEDIILSNAGNHIFGRIIDNIVIQKRDEKLREAETEMETLQRHKEEWLKSLKVKYGVETDKELFSIMSFDEKATYLTYMDQISKVWEKENKLFDEEQKRFERKYGKKKI